MNKLDELKDLITALQKKEEEKQKNTVLLVLAVLALTGPVFMKMKKGKTEK